MIDVSKAARIANDYFRDLFADEAYTKIRLAEAELTEDQKFWFVIIGYEEKPIGSLGLDLVHRKFKCLKIDAETGTLISIKSHRVKS